MDLFYVCFFMLCSLKVLSYQKMLTLVGLVSTCIFLKTAHVAFLSAQIYSFTLTQNQAKMVKEKMDLVILFFFHFFCFHK